MTGIPPGWGATLRHVIHAEALGFDPGPEIEHIVSSQHGWCGQDGHGAVRTFGIARAIGPVGYDVPLSHGKAADIVAAGGEVLSWTVIRLWWRTLPAPLREDCRQLRADRIAVSQAWDQLLGYLQQDGRAPSRFGPPKDDAVDFHQALRDLHARGDALWDRALDTGDDGRQLDLFGAVA